MTPGMGLVWPLILSPRLLPKQGRIIEMEADSKMEVDPTNAVKRPRDENDDEKKGEDEKAKVARGDDHSDVSKAREMNPNRNREFVKQKVIVLFGYLGENYNGLQRNPGVVTVESVLEKAFVAAGGITADNAGSFTKVSWASTARTDKGVSAVGNCVSLKAVMIPNLKEEIQKHLPQDIRVFAIQRVIGHFNPKDRCSSRRYYYVLPTFVFAPTGSDPSEFKFTPTVRETINEVLKEFEGTHAYHNFTGGGGPKRPGDPAANRYVYSFTCGEPFNTEDGEWVQLCVHGQSFVYNQIRKMVAMVICAIRDGQHKNVINSVFQRRKKIVPLAPALGLFLFRAYFEYYNKDVKPPSEPITFEDSMAEMEEFKVQHILPHIIQTNKRDKVYQSWLDIFKEFPVDYADLFENDVNVPAKEGHFPRSFYEDERPSGSGKQTAED